MTPTHHYVTQPLEKLSYPPGVWSSLLTQIVDPYVRPTPMWVGRTKLPENIIISPALGQEDPKISPLVPSESDKNLWDHLSLSLKKKKLWDHVTNVCCGFEVWWDEQMSSKCKQVLHIDHWWQLMGLVNVLKPLCKIIYWAKNKRKSPLSLL